MVTDFDTSCILLNTFFMINPKISLISRPSYLLIPEGFHPCDTIQKRKGK